MAAAFPIHSFINFPLFIITLAIGLFAVYIMSAEKHVVRVYPTHDNYDNIQYKDKAGVCFSLEETKVKCPANDRDILHIKPQV